MESADTGSFIGDSSHMKTAMKAHREQGSNKLTIKQELWLPAKATGAWGDALEMQAVSGSVYNYVTFILLIWAISSSELWSHPLPCHPFLACLHSPHPGPLPLVKSCAYRWYLSVFLPSI